MPPPRKEASVVLVNIIEMSKDSLSLYLHFAGLPVYLNYSFGWANVKDVALAHVLAFETPSASGRYCMTDKVVHFSDVVKIIHDMYPSLPMPDK
uniref:Uncharacterized protein n=1 Tax=Arundo donax TaxID=35708 RepID=A0A0A9DIW4_ARUDO